MTTETQSAEGSPPPTLRVLAQYAKSVSMVTREGVQAQGLPGQPNIDLGVDLSSNPIEGQNKVFETVLKLIARAHVGEDTVFEIELAYAGVFDVSAAPEEIMEPVLMIDCPRLLFPFARRIVAEMSREGGFPPLLIDPIDFAGLYQNQLAQQSQA